MLKIERHNIIEQEIRKQGFVLVPGLSALLACSEETIRRDLKEMEQAGKLVRTHGGAYLVEKYDKGYPLELRKSYLQHTKERLAEAALASIQDNDVIMLDASTTCLSIAETILARGISVTLITNSLAVFTLFGEANSNVNLIGVGGTFRRRTSSFADPNTVEALRGYYADKAFISCPKLSPEFGLSDNHISEANVRKQMLKNAQKRFQKLHGLVRVRVFICRSGQRFRRFGEHHSAVFICFSELRNGFLYGCEHIPALQRL